MEQKKDQQIDTALKLLDEMNDEEAERFISGNLEGLAVDSGSEQSLEPGSA